MAASRLAPVLVLTISTTSAVTALTIWLGSATAQAGSTNTTAAARAAARELMTLYIEVHALIARARLRRTCERPELAQKKEFDRRSPNVPRTRKRAAGRTHMR